MIVAGDVLDTGGLWRTVVASFVAGVRIVFVFSLAVLDMSGYSAAKRGSRHLAAGGFGLLATVGLLLTLAAVVLGLIVMAHKS